MLCSNGNVLLVSSDSSQCLTSRIRLFRSGERLFTFFTLFCRRSKSISSSLSPSSVDPKCTAGLADLRLFDFLGTPSRVLSLVGSFEDGTGAGDGFEWPFTRGAGEFVDGRDGCLAPLAVCCEAGFLTSRVSLRMVGGGAFAAPGLPNVEKKDML